jgi:hypothetical protein
MLQRREEKALLKVSLAWVSMKAKNITRAFSPTHLPADPSTRLLLLLFLCFSLTSCGLFNAGPSTTVVEKAVVQKLEQTQALLRSQLSSNEPATDSLGVGQVSISSTHRVVIGNQPAIEVEGTYRLKGGNLSRSQRREVRPFDLYLRQGSETDQWLLLEPVAGQESAPNSSWQAIPIS